MKMLANKRDDVTNAIDVGSLYVIRFDRGLHVMIVWAPIDSPCSLKQSTANSHFFFVIKSSMSVMFLSSHSTK